MSEWELEEHWVTAGDAPGRVGRSRRTIYRWIAEGRVNTIRPSRILWLSVPDLLLADKETLRRIRGVSS